MTRWNIWNIDTYEHMNPQIVSNQVDMHNNKIQLSCNILCLILDMLYSSPCTHQYLKDDKKKWYVLKYILFISQ